MPATSSSIVVDVPPKVIYGVALDFESYPDFLSDVKKVTIKKAKDLLVEFELHLLKKIRYTLKVKGVPYRKIDWSLVEGDFKKNEGSWTFEPVNGKTKATYSVTIEFGLFVPSLITNQLIGSSLPVMMRRFKERAEGL